MSKSSLSLPVDFPNLLKEIKTRIQQAQARAVLSVNAELVRLYWDIGRMIDVRQRQEGWGAAVIPRLAHELHNELPEEKGFSERNIKRMLAFYRAYPTPAVIVPPAVAHNYRLDQKCHRLWHQPPRTTIRSFGPSLGVTMRS